MKAYIKLGVCIGLAVAAFTGTTLAVTDGYTTDNAGIVTYNSVDGTYSASYSGVTIGQQYVLLVVKGATDDYIVSEDTIMYIDQVEASNVTVSFDSWIPRNTPECVVLLGGEFGDDTSPKVLGTLIAQGVTVNGTVRFQDSRTGATVTLWDKNGQQISSVTTGIDGAYSFTAPVGNGYRIEVTKQYYCKYTATDVSIEEGGTLREIDIRNLAGDVNENGEVNGYDLNTLLQDFNKDAEDNLQSPGSDLNQNGSVNGYDLNILLSGFNSGPTEESWSK